MRLARESCEESMAESKERGAYEAPVVEDLGQIHEVTRMPPPSKVSQPTDSVQGSRPHPGQGSGVIG